jgi:hypothetical protein
MSSSSWRIFICVSTSWWYGSIDMMLDSNSNLKDWSVHTKHVCLSQNGGVILFVIYWIYIQNSCKDGSCTGTRNKLFWIVHSVIRLRSLPCKSVDGHLGFCSVSKFRTAASSENFPEKWRLVEEFRVHDGCTLSTMPRAARLFAALYDQEPARKSRRYFARMAHSQSRHQLSAMMSRSTAQIATCYILLVLNKENSKTDHLLDMRHMQ